jgi:acetoin utilization deacetylase AcuC-like enzyme
MRVFTSHACLKHHPGAEHPDQPARLAAVLDELGSVPSIEVTEAPAASIHLFDSCHDRSYLEHAAELSALGGGELGTDTVLNQYSWAATLGAGGAALAALDSSLASGGPTFAAIRPPGHHALRHRAMGFCIVNHVAVLAREAIRRGRERVLIIDWDVHHGNGTQAMVEHDAAICFVSMHQWPWYPGSGAADERGIGNCFNLPMSAGLPSSMYVETLWRGVEHATDAWQPDVILISAGYDGMLGDPLGGFTLEPSDYVTWVERLRDRFPDVPLVALMEGGYAPARLAAGVVATVTAMGS